MFWHHRWTAPEIPFRVSASQGNRNDCVRLFSLMLWNSRSGGKKLCWIDVRERPITCYKGVLQARVFFFFFFNTEILHVVNMNNWSSHTTNVQAKFLVLFFFRKLYTLLTWKPGVAIRQAFNLRKRFMFESKASWTFDLYGLNEEPELCWEHLFNSSTMAVYNATIRMLGSHKPTCALTNCSVC